MTVNIQTYMPGMGSLSFMGYLITGFGDEIVTAKRNNPMMEMVAGADGETALRQSADLTGTIEITLKQTSFSNSVLMGILARQELGIPQAGPVQFTDNLGNTCFAGEGVIAGPPEMKRGKDLQDQVWTILCSRLSFIFTALPAVV